MKLSIIIPVYNEKNSILEILRKVDEVDFGNIQKEVVIIDDFSIDGTRQIIEGLTGDYKIIFHNQNQGKGSAIRTGLKVATGDYAVIQDADLEYDPRDLRVMVEKMLAERLTVLYGSRRLKKDNVQYSGLLFYFGGWLLTILTNILYGQRLTDEPTCYKMFKTDFIKSLPLQCHHFEFCPEVTALTALKGIKIPEVPISYYPRHKKEGKKIRWYDELVAIWVLLKYRIRI
ncbi:MAG: Glycosyl transferase family 2 [Candidatus Magasanikbacteria bacterium GW2011_GWA2_40_10]|uniref:Glycosyl transferase family 2 n=1 Tax=Candidatus Magasanikbacteria bacterium GW2011_GWA2_40_10 TaxID=1619037 RepID=A0A0G0QB11_9BACT|nr:MAG: Glycosyl transferase family 2 [Candidatus Magasanikbacteria bacterium GW2011_GWA2_40_10]